MIEKIKNCIIHLLGGKTLQEFNSVTAVMDGYKNTLNMCVGTMGTASTMRAYIATDKNNKNYLYFTNKPTKHIISWVDCSDNARFLRLYDVELPSNIAPSWDDDEPTPVIIKIQKL